MKVWNSPDFSLLWSIIPKHTHHHLASVRTCNREKAVSVDTCQCQSVNEKKVFFHEYRPCHKKKVICLFTFSLIISKPSPSKRCRLIKVRGTGCVTKKTRSNKPTFVFFPQSWNTCNERWILLSGSWFEENRVAHIDDLISTLNTAVIPPYHYSLVLKVRSRLVSC